MSDLKEKILAKFGDRTLAALATVTEEGKPWVRYVTVVADENLNLWFATFIRSRKVAHIRNNPEVHLTAGVTSLEAAESYLQIQGRAEILTDEASRQSVWNDHLATIFSGPDDPDFAVCRVTPYRIEYQSMGLVPPEVWEP